MTNILSIKDYKARKMLSDQARLDELLAGLHDDLGKLEVIMRQYLDSLLKEPIHGIPKPPTLL